jgi:type IV fimbrial biogenesis protein FimT
MYNINHGKAWGGFTLVELMVTIALLAILLSLGIPAFTELLAGWQRDRATKAITAHLQLARTEAIKSTQRVVVCNSSDASTCSTSKDKEWKSGWIVFQDLNGNNQRDRAEAVLTSAPALQGIQSLSTNINNKRFVFMPTGIMASGMSTLEVIPQTGRTQKITVSRIGRVRLSMTTKDP